MKKAGFALDNTGNLILALIVLLVILALIFFLKQPISDLTQKIISLFAFG